MDGQESVWGVLLRDYPSKLVIMYNLNGDVMQVSDQSQAFLGIPAYVFEQTRMSVTTVMHRDDVAMVFKGFADLMESDEGVTVELYHRMFSDMGRYVELSSQFFLFSLNKVPQLFFSVSTPMAFCDPIRVNCLEEVHAQSFTAQLSSTAEFISVSPASLPILGVYPSHLLGRAFREFLCPADLEFFGERFLEASKAGSSELVFSILFKCGEGEFVPVVVTLGFVPSGDASCYVCLCTIGRISTSSIGLQVSNIGSYQASMLHGLAPPISFDVPPSSALHFIAPRSAESSASSSLPSSSLPSSSSSSSSLASQKRKGSNSPPKNHLRKPGRRASEAQIVITSRSQNHSSDLSPSPPRSYSLDGFHKGDGESEDKERKTAYRPSRRTDLVCEFCGRNESPEWRRGPSGSNTLCNACGIKYAKKRKSQELKGGEDLEKMSKPRKRKPSTGTESNSSTGSNPTPTTEVMNLLDLGLDKMHNEWANIAT